MTDVSALSGRKLDAAVAVEVFGLGLEHLQVLYEEGNTPDGGDGWSGFVCPRCRLPEDMLNNPCCKAYSADHNHAAEVRAKMCELYPGYGWKIVQLRGEEIAVHFYDFGFIESTPDYVFQSPSECVAVCRVALMARRALG